MCEETPQSVEDNRPSVASVTPEALSQVDIEAPIADCRGFDTGDLGYLYGKAVEVANKAGKKVEAAVYGLLQGI